MLRRALKRPKRFRFEDVREMARKDREYFDWLLSCGFVAGLGDGWYALTDRGKAAADLGLYEFTAADAEPRTDARTPKSRK
jgi:hypothetical protein